MGDLDFERVIDAWMDAVLVSEGGDHVSYANAAAERLLGWSREELAGAPLASLFPSIDARKLLGRTSRVRARRKSAPAIDVDLTISSSRDCAGREVVCCSVRSDAPIPKQVRDAEEALRAQDDFLAIASHELRTPLTPLQLHVQGIQRMLRRGRFADLPPVELGQKLDAMERQVRRIERLIESLIDATRVTDRRMLLAPEELDLATLVRDVVARHRGDAERAGCCLEADIDAPLFGVWDRARIDQMVSNLLTNAIKFGSGGAIDVHVRRDRVKRGVQIEVRDHGIGIASRDQVRIFERFQRAVPALHYGGFGLGLWIVRKIVEAMDGAVAVASEPGEGTSFTVDLPVISTRLHATPPVPSA